MIQAQQRGLFSAIPHPAGHVCALAFLLVCGSARTLAQSPQPTRTRRPLLLDQNRFRLRAGDRLPIATSPEAVNFLRDAEATTITANGSPGRGFAVAPSAGGHETLLGVSLTTAPGEYTVTVSAVSESGEERRAVAEVQVDALPVVPSGGSTPPVVLLNGWQIPSVFPPTTCPIASNGSVGTFGKLQPQLAAPAVYFFDNCVERSVNGSTIEQLGATLGQFLDMIQYSGGALVPQVDLVSHSMGGLIARSYLAGLQTNGSPAPPANPRVRKFIQIATPNFGSFLAGDYSALLTNGTQAAEMVPGSSFLWSLDTWNELTDDLRGVDSIAIIGDAGYWRPSVFSAPQLLNVTDGVVTVTSAALYFSRDPSRTRMLPYCHIGPESAGYSLIDCSGKGGIANVDEAPETGQIILSFLAGTSAWQSVGSSNQTQYAGAYFTVENPAGTQFTQLSSVYFGSSPFESGWTNGIYYNEFVSGTGYFTINQATTCGPDTLTGGMFWIARCKAAGPLISFVNPLLIDAPPYLVPSGGTITISVGNFGQPCPGCAVAAYPGPAALQVSSWTDTAISAFLPSTFHGITGVQVQSAAGADYITFMSAPPSAIHFSISAPASATAGVPFSLPVTALDANNNPVVGYAGTVHFTSSDPSAVLPANLTLSQGTGNFSATLNTAGPQTITATDSSNPAITGSSAGISVGAQGPGVPSAYSVTPGAGTGSNATLTFTFGDSGGYQNLTVVNVLINNSLDGRAACYLAYSQSAGVLYLVGDNGGSLSAGLTLGGAGSVSNSQCTVTAAGSSAVGSGNTLTLRLAITFTSGFAGDKAIYLATRDQQGGNSGWQALGTFSVPGFSTFPAVGGVSPASGGGPNGTFTFTFSDTKGFQDLGVVNILINSSLDGRGACYLAFSQPSNTLYLVPDSGGGLLPGISLNGTGTTGNSQCTVSAPGSAVIAAGNELALQLNLSFASGFAGNHIVYMAARDNAGANNSGWLAAGAWQVP